MWRQLSLLLLSDCLIDVRNVPGMSAVATLGEQESESMHMPLLKELEQVVSSPSLGGFLRGLGPGVIPPMRMPLSSTVLGSLLEHIRTRGANMVKSVESLPFKFENQIPQPIIVTPYTLQVAPNMMGPLWDSSPPWDWSPLGWIPPAMPPGSREYNPMFAGLPLRPTSASWRPSWPFQTGPGIGSSWLQQRFPFLTQWFNTPRFLLPPPKSSMLEPNELFEPLMEDDSSLDGYQISRLPTTDTRRERRAQSGEISPFGSIPFVGPIYRANNNGSLSSSSSVFSLFTNASNAQFRERGGTLETLALSPNSPWWARLVFYNALQKLNALWLWNNNGTDPWPYIKWIGGPWLRLYTELTGMPPAPVPLTKYFLTHLDENSTEGTKWMIDYMNDYWPVDYRLSGNPWKEWDQAAAYANALNSV